MLKKLKIKQHLLKGQWIAINNLSFFIDIIKNSYNMNDDHKFVTLLCPTNAQTAKLTNRFIKFMFEMRKRIELGENMFQL